MTDKEKIAEHLDDCLAASKQDNAWVFVRKDIVADTLALLKEQEAVVRCGDCVNGEPFENGIMCNCEAHEKDWFCADGKRA